MATYKEIRPPRELSRENDQGRKADPAGGQFPRLAFFVVVALGLLLSFFGK